MFDLLVWTIEAWIRAGLWRRTVGLNRRTRKLRLAVQRKIRGYFHSCVGRKHPIPPSMPRNVGLHVHWSPYTVKMWYPNPRMRTPGRKVPISDYYRLLGPRLWTFDLLRLNVGLHRWMGRNRIARPIRLFRRITCPKHWLSGLQRPKIGYFRRTVGLRRWTYGHELLTGIFRQNASLHQWTVWHLFRNAGLRVGPQSILNSDTISMVRVISFT